MTFADFDHRFRIPPETGSVLDEVLKDVRRTNEVTNLVADASDPSLRLHVEDSLHLLLDPAAGEGPLRFIDVGTGGGFPGLPLLVVRPAWRGVFVDSVKKKADALAEILDRRLPGRGSALWGRAETLARETVHRETYDLAFCRAVGRFSTVLELTLPFLKAGGALLAHRGHEAPEETAALRPVAEGLGGGIEGATPYRLPGMEKDRYIVRVVKRNPSPPAYPRRNGVPAKRPLTPKDVARTGDRP